MLIFGAIDFSAALATIAGGMGYRVTIADPRSAFLRSARFSSSAETIEAWPQDVLADQPLGPRDAVLVFTHDTKLDVPALIAAFATDAGYIGALGSRKTTEEREHRLREAGATDADLARMHAPAGLDIGAATVEETAIAVLAEITAGRAGRPGVSLRDSAGPIRRDRGATASLTAPTDPGS
jgi:xanthine dehydrogenase accessory factor